MKVGSTSVKGYLADFRDRIHLGKINRKQVWLLEVDSVVFEKEFSPIEFLKPDELEVVLERIRMKRVGE